MYFPAKAALAFAGLRNKLESNKIIEHAAWGHNGKH